MKLEDLAAPISKTWNTIAGDVLAMEGGHNVDTELMLELCIDADRIAMYGSPEANAFIKQWLADHDHDWDALVTALRPIIDPHGYNRWGY